MTVFNKLNDRHSSKDRCDQKIVHEWFTNLLLLHFSNGNICAARTANAIVRELVRRTSVLVASQGCCERLLDHFESFRIESHGDIGHEQSREEKQFLNEECPYLICGGVCCSIVWKWCMWYADDPCALIVVPCEYGIEKDPTGRVCVTY